MRQSDNKRGLTAAATENQPKPATTVPPAASSAPLVKIKPVDLEKAPRDFFGRPIQLAPESSTATANPSISAPPPVKTEGTKVWYKFNEGFSNAVRKPVSIKDLL